jgi:hypothetical protein
MSMREVFHNAVVKRCLGPTWPDEAGQTGLIYELSIRESETPLEAAFPPGISFQLGQFLTQVGGIQGALSARGYPFLNHVTWTP